MNVLLVANRGEIARRIMRTARAVGLRTVAVYAEPDADAPFVHEADRAVPLGGTTSAETYLDVAALVGAARAAGADAVHPGYGFLAESPELARACAAAGLTFVGPPAEAIERMANKITAKELAAAAGVPVLPTGLLTGPEDPRAAAVAAEVGFPLLVKAAAGGGGKGMRRVDDPADLGDALAGAAREAQAAFGDGSLFLERYVGRGRHVEVQVFADTHGAAVALADRDCSIQRRHQKVIEGAPAPDLLPAVRETLHAGSVALAKAIGYVGAGTVEFLVDGPEAFFLEMNTRLQVEHPVTEEVLGLDLVRLQLAVARGEALPAGLGARSPVGHAVEVRVYAERPAQGWLPATGTVTHYVEPTGAGVRVDSAVAAGSEITAHFDPMIAKVVAHGADRAEAFVRLRRALDAFVLVGVETNLDFLRAACSDAELLAGPQATTWLDTRTDLAAAAPPPEVERAHAVLATLAFRHRVRHAAALPVEVPTGWRNVHGTPQVTRWTTPDGETVEVGVASAGRGRDRVTVDGVPVAVHVRSVGPDVVDAEVDGLRLRRRVFVDGDRFGVVGPEWQTVCTRETAADRAAGRLSSGACVAPLPGTVVRVNVEVGDVVAAGDPLVVLESMKMEHVVKAGADAVVDEVRAAAGGSVALGEVLVVLKEDA